jgi:hypothetical protein
MNSGRIAVLVAWALNISLATIYIPHVCLLKFAGDRLTSTTPMTTATNGTGDFHRAIMHDHYDYDRIYRSFGTHESYKDVRSLEFKSFGTYTSPGIRNYGCRLTVVVVDPRPPSSAVNHPIWYALESVASYVPSACVVINTASCHVFNTSDDSTTKSSTNEEEINAVASAIYERALPLFRRMMEFGLVRINILNVKKYGLDHCDNFENGNRIFMNIHFWTDEFIEGVDGEMILTVQGDSVLCRHFEIDSWRHFAYVGSPWEGTTCDTIRKSLHEWAPRCNGVTTHQLSESISQYCTKGYGGFQGNGGLSIRNRTWMAEAIQRCPTHYSGLDASESFHLIEWHGPQGEYLDGYDFNEDVYFATILTGLNATMPSAFEASLFSVETLFSEQTVGYLNLEESELVETIKQLWNNDTGDVMYHRMHQRDSYFDNFSAVEIVPELHTIPLGFHKPWLYHPVNIFQGAQVREE